MAFELDIPNYKNLSSNKFLTNSIPNEIWSKIEAYATKSSREKNLATLVNRLNDIVLIPHTQNWGHNYLIGDLKDTMFEIKKQTEEGNFRVFMDCLSEIVDFGEFDINEINNFLEKYNIGYIINIKPFFDGYYWKVRDESVKELTENINNTKEAVKTISQQAYENLTEAKKLTTSSNEREIKNALWNCVCAMESVVKHCAKINSYSDDVAKNIDQAIKHLSNNNLWGNKKIIKDGLAIFNDMHNLYPDLRHGSIEKPSSLSLSEAIYWIERLTAYINYMIKTAKKTGEKI